MKASTFLMLCLVLLQLKPYAQTGTKTENFNSDTMVHQPYALHLFTSQPIYEPGQTIYFGCLLRNALDLSVADEIPALSFDLVDQRDQVVESKLFRLKSGSAVGQFKSVNSGGLYQIRAYLPAKDSSSQLVINSAFFQVQQKADEQLQIVIATDKNVYGPGDTVSAKVSLRKGVLALRGQEITAHLLINGSTFLSQKWQTDAEGNARLTMKIPSEMEIKFSSLYIETSAYGRVFSNARIMHISSEVAQLQFFPEGGQLISGQWNRLAFKATDLLGMPAVVKGVIRNVSGTVMLPFESVHDGMGSLDFFIDKPEYFYAQLDTVEGSAVFSLPKVEERGISLRISSVDSLMHVEITQNEGEDMHLFLRKDHKICFARHLGLKDNFQMDFPTDTFLPGVYEWIVTNATAEIKARRLVFFNEDRRMNARCLTEISMDVEQKEPLRLSIANQAGEGQKVHFLAVLSEDKWFTYENPHERSVHYDLWVKPAIKEKVYMPGIYFGESHTSAHLLDLLMLCSSPKETPLVRNDVLHYQWPLLVLKPRYELYNAAKVMKYNYTMNKKFIYQDRDKNPLEIDSNQTLIQRHDPFANNNYVYVSERANLRKADRLYFNESHLYLKVPHQPYWMNSTDLVASFEPDPLIEKQAIADGGDSRKEITIQQENKRDKGLSFLASRTEATAYFIDGIRALPASSVNSIAAYAPSQQIDWFDESRYTSSLSPLIEADRHREIGGRNSLREMVKRNYRVPWFPSTGNELRINGGDYFNGYWIPQANPDRIGRSYGNFRDYPGVWLSQIKIQSDELFPIFSPGVSSWGMRNSEIYLLSSDEEGEAELNFRYFKEGNYTLRLYACDVDGSILQSEIKLDFNKSISVKLTGPEMIYTGDEAGFEASIKNNGSRPLKGKILIELKEDYFRSQLIIEENVELDQGQKRNYQFSVPAVYDMYAKRNQLSIRFVNEESSGRDAYVYHDFEVRRGGKIQKVLHCNESGQASFQMEIDSTRYFPKSMEINLYHMGDVRRELTHALDEMVRMPTGCFEQLGSSNYPNLLAMEYKQRTNTANASWMSLMGAYLENTYRRMTAYECSGGGFSWFGQGKGKLGLTAFGLLQFDLMDQYIDTDKKVTERTIAWLSSEITAMANLLEEGKLSEFKKAELFYAVWACSRIEIKQDEKVYELLEHEETDDLYLLSLFANTMWELEYREKAMAANEKIRDVFLSADINGYIATIGFTGSKGKSLQTECIALAIKSLINSEEDSLLVHSLLADLMRLKTSKGLWSNTQSTVLALEAVLACEALIPEGETSQRVDWEIAVNDQIYTITTLSGEYETMVIPDSVLTHGVNQVRLSSSHEAPVLVNSRWMYLPEAETSSASKLVAQILEDSIYAQLGKAVNLMFSLSNLHEFDLGQTVCQLPLTDALEVNSEQLRRLMERQIISYYDWQENTLNLYFEKVNKGQSIEFPLQMKVVHTGTYSIQPLVTFAYYQPEICHTDKWIPVFCEDLPFKGGVRIH